MATSILGLPQSPTFLHLQNSSNDYKDWSDWGRWAAQAGPRGPRPDQGHGHSGWEWAWQLQEFGTWNGPPASFLSPPAAWPRVLESPHPQPPADMDPTCPGQLDTSKDNALFLRRSQFGNSVSLTCGRQGTPRSWRLGFILTSFWKVTGSETFCSKI